jgi:peroxiredoxin Q/BCP
VPDFTVPATGGEFTLSAHLGKPVVLYFYPKDNTPGCTTQAQQFRDLHRRIRQGRLRRGRRFARFAEVA